MHNQEIRSTVRDVLQSIDVIDMHTHLFPPSFGGTGLWGIDELVTYHYLEAELFRSSPVTPEQYFALSKTEKADLIWRTLFIENTPISEATRGVCAVLQAFGLKNDLSEARRFFQAQKLEDHVTQVMKLAGVSQIVMTNDPLDPAEAPHWGRALDDDRFRAVLRLDRILNKWADHWQLLAGQGYAVDAAGGSRQVRRFLDQWIERMKPLYMAVSLPWTFQFPADDLRTEVLREAVLPACRDHKLPLSLMIGVRYLVNPALRLAEMPQAGRTDGAGNPVP
ncbi:MAG: hypothetical protein WKF37_02045 [Bryobacteraceae bacterium]